MSKINPLIFYLDWVNNYLTVKKISEDYNITEKEALSLIEYGKKMNEDETLSQNELETLNNLLGRLYEQTDMDNMELLQAISNLTNLLNN